MVSIAVQKVAIFLGYLNFIVFFLLNVKLKICYALEGSELLVWKKEVMSFVVTICNIVDAWWIFIVVIF